MAETKAALREFLTNVEAAPEGVELERVATWLEAHNMPSAQAIEGFKESEVEAMSTGDDALTVVLLAFVRRVVRTAMVVASAKRSEAHPPRGSEPSSAAAPAAAPPSLAPGSAFAGLIGAEASGLAVANALMAAKDSVNVMDLLKKAGFEGMPFEIQAEAAVFQLLQCATNEAKKIGKTAFTYVDLTAKELLPMWMPHSAVGGKAGLDLEYLGGGASAISALGNALKQAATQPRFFRSPVQFFTCFMRYALVAVTTEQLTWALVFSHLNIVSKLMEDERAAGNSVFVAFLYDDLVRRLWSRQVEVADPNFDFAKAAGELDKAVLESARSRLTNVMSAAGLTKADGTAELPIGAADSALAKTASAAEAVVRRAEQAQRAMVATQEQLLQTSAWAGRGRGGKGAGGKPGRSSPSSGSGGYAGGWGAGWGPEPPAGPPPQGTQQWPAPAGTRKERKRQFFASKRSEKKQRYAGQYQ